MDRVCIPLEQRWFGQAVRPDAWRLRPLAVFVRLSAPRVHTPWAVGHGGCPGEVPLRREGTPEAMAVAVRFLVEADYITGQIIIVDGGWSVA